MAEENKLSYQEIEERRKQKIAELTDRIESGMTELMNSASFREYLSVMARFTRYSPRNTLLIYMQKPDATMVAAYGDWQKKFGRSVKRGEKGIQIIAPAPYKTKREVDVIDPATGQPVIGADGEPQKTEKEITIPRFKAVTVFDYSQTAGRPLPTLGIKDLQASVDKFDMFFESIRRISPVPIRFDNIEGGAKGYYDRANKEIVIQAGMPELQTLKTACHELVHSHLHDDPSKMLTQDGVPKSKEIRETEAEACAFVCLTHFGFKDVGDYSFPYLSSYASGTDMKEFHASLATIQETSYKVIKGIETEMLQQLVEHDMDRYEIYQIPIGSPARDSKFVPLEEVRRQYGAIDAVNYSMVYSAKLENGETLNSLYEKFNTDHPADYAGHSLSISDVIVLHKGGEDRAYYVDSFGFEEIPGFLEGTPYVPAMSDRNEAGMSGSDRDKGSDIKYEPPAADRRSHVAERKALPCRRDSLLQDLRIKQASIDRTAASDKGSKTMDVNREGHAL